MVQYLAALLLAASVCCPAAASRPIEQLQGPAVLTTIGQNPAALGGGLEPRATRQAVASGAAASGPLRKRGVGATHLTLPELTALKGLAWWYSWGPRVWSDSVAEAAADAGVEFVPMQWGQGGVEQLGAELQAGSRVLLGFNEPNHGEQAGITPQDAAALWPQLEAVADRLGLRLGSPSPGPCGRNCVGPPDPFAWLDQFFAACHGCRVDFLTAHYYACNPGWLMAYLQQHRKYGRPVWLTEFACPNPGGPPVRSLQYMAQVLPMLDRDGFVERYAWFALQTDGWLGTSNSLMNISTNELTDLGKLYLSLVADEREKQQVEPGTGDVGGGAAAAEPGAAPPHATWSELCAPCIAHLQDGRQLEELEPEAQRYCGDSCGFWAMTPALLSQAAHVQA
ncbi:hypothetical protein ABPG77_004361 [Micractinium sp. CCAP 211/92]